MTVRLILNVGFCPKFDIFTPHFLSQSQDPVIKISNQQLLSINYVEGKIPWNYYLTKYDPFLIITPAMIPGQDLVSYKNYEWNWVQLSWGKWGWGGEEIWQCLQILSDRIMRRNLHGRLKTTEQVIWGNNESLIESMLMIVSHDAVDPADGSVALQRPPLQTHMSRVTGQIRGSHGNFYGFLMKLDDFLRLHHLMFSHNKMLPGTSVCWRKTSRKETDKHIWRSRRWVSTCWTHHQISSSTMSNNSAKCWKSRPERWGWWRYALIENLIMSGGCCISQI